MPNHNPRRRLLVLVVAVVVCAADQVTKTWALHHATPPRHLFGTIWLNLTFNSGAAFGLGRGVTPVVEAAVVVIVVVLFVVGRRTAARATVPGAVALGLLTGGALGNLSDRIVRDHHGAVIDFLDVAQVGGHEYWPVFNLADASVVVGAALLVLTYSRASPRRAPDSAPNESRPPHDQTVSDG